MPQTHKSNRSLAKRIKITGTGKVLKRAAGQNHFNAKNSGDTGIKRRRISASPQSFTKSFQKLLPSRNIAS